MLANAVAFRSQSPLLTRATVTRNFIGTRADVFP
jgi:hypothetical protein